MSLFPSFGSASLGECGYMSEFKHLVCNIGIITCADPARVLKVSSLVFVKGFEISNAKCCTLRDATLLTQTIGSLVAEKPLLAPGAGKTPEKYCFALNQSIPFLHGSVSNACNL